MDNGDSKIITDCLNEKGVACIKPEYLAVRTEIEYDCALISGPKDSITDDGSKRKENENQQQGTDSRNFKKKKMKGQNKNRRDVMIKGIKSFSSKDKMCMAFCRENQCQFGENCTFSHDLDLYLQDKPPDISDICSNFVTFGKCNYGILCRFASSHLKDGKHNVIDEEKYLRISQQNKINNILPKEVQVPLRKKQYDFTRANNFSGRISSEQLKISDAKCEVRSMSLKKKIDFNQKLYLAPLTTLGNLPFRRICKEFGAEITCGEMALCTNILEGGSSEWALLRRHSSEDIFGVQLCGASADQLARCAQVICQECDIDFIDLNMGCPIDMIFKKGAGSALMERKKKLDHIIYSVSSVSDVPLTLKMRTGVYNNKNMAHSVISTVREWGNDRVGLITVHGRSREQRYTKLADWDYIKECALEANKPIDGLDPIPLFGSGDILSQEEYYDRLEYSKVNGIMIGRGALIKPWIFEEIKERKTRDITAEERFEILRKFTNYGLEYWGSDTEGVEKTRRFLLEWLSFLYRYIPVGLLERPPQRINERPPRYVGRNDLETLLSSPSCNDWISISEMLLGKVPQGFTFIPKHKANSY